MKTFLFNPYTGQPRHPLDIQSDPEGLAIHDPGEPLRAATPLAASAPAQQAPTLKNFSVSREWLAEKLEKHDDADAAAGQTNPQAPCKTYPGCNGSNCLGCGEATTPQPVAAEEAKDTQRLDWLDARGYAYGFEDMHEGNRWMIDGPYRTIRIAIDAAMAGTGSDESKENGK